MRLPRAACAAAALLAAEGARPPRRGDDLSSAPTSFAEAGLSQASAQAFAAVESALDKISIKLVDVDKSGAAATAEAARWRDASLPAVFVAGNGVRMATVAVQKVMDAAHAYARKQVEGESFAHGGHGVSKEILEAGSTRGRFEGSLERYEDEPPTYMGAREEDTCGGKHFECHACIAGGCRWMAAGAGACTDTCAVQDPRCLGKEARCDEEQRRKPSRGGASFHHGFLA